MAYETIGNPRTTVIVRWRFFCSSQRYHYHPNKQMPIVFHSKQPKLLATDERHIDVLIRDYTQAELAALTEQNRQGGE